MSSQGGAHLTVMSVNVLWPRVGGRCLLLGEGTARVLGHDRVDRLPGMKVLIVVEDDPDAWYASEQAI